MRRSIPAAGAVIGFIGSLGLCLRTWSGVDVRTIPGGIANSEFYLAWQPRLEAFATNLACEIGIALCLLVGWLSTARASREWQRVILTVWLIPLVLALPFGSGDMFNYTEQGWALLHGNHPSIVPAGSTPGPFQNWAGLWEGTTVAYPWLGLALSAISTWLGQGNELACLLLQRIWPVLGLWLMWACLPAVAGALKLNRDLSRWVVVANPLMLMHGICGGHNDVLSVALSLAGISLALSSWRSIAARSAGALALIVVGGLVKPFGVLLVSALLGAILLKHQRQVKWFVELIGSALLTGLVLLLAIAVSGLLPGGFAWLRASGAPGMWTRSLVRDLEIGFIYSQRAQETWPKFTAFWLANVDLIGIVLAISLMALLLIKRPSYGPFAIPAIIWAALLFFGPVAWPWYAVNALPALGLLTCAYRKQVASVLVFCAWGVPFWFGPPMGGLRNVAKLWGFIGLVWALLIPVFIAKQPRKDQLG